jgi:hypothetical protein
MKKNNLFIYFTGIFLLVFAACEKDYQGSLMTQPNVGPIADMANIQYYNSTLNSVRTYLYVDNVLVSGSATGYAASSLYPSTSPSRITLSPGSRAITVKDTLATTTQTPVSVTGNFEAGSSYTVFSYDTLNKAKALFVKDNIVVPEDTTARVRFANMIYSATAVPNIDVYSVRKQGNVFTNVPTSTVTDFITYAAATPLSDTLFVRATGTTTNLATLAGFNATRKRSYTMVFRGRYQTTGTTGVARTLTSFTSY